MGIRSVRFHDLLAVHRIEANRSTHALWPSPLEVAHSATHLALASAWQDVNQTVFTFVAREHGDMLGFIQTIARTGHDAWDLVRLALAVDSPDERERVADLLVDQALYATGGRGGLRTFARAPLDRDGHALLTARGFRQYAAEYTLVGESLDVEPTPLPDHLRLRARRPSDAWGIFQLYCSVAPAPVRHAEGLSSKRWSRGSWLAHSLVGHLFPVHEVVLDDEGLIVGWVRLTRMKGYAAQQLEVLLHPRAYAALPALLAHAMVALEARLDHRTLCKVRAYEDAVLGGLQAVGFTVAEEHALLVRHAAARVTERQLLIAALRAQSLGLDVSHAHQHDGGITPARVHSTALESPRHYDDYH